MTREARLVIVLLMNLALIGALAAVGVTAHALGVLAAGGDYLADAAAIAVSLLAIWLSRRPDPGTILRLASRTPRVDGLPVLLIALVVGYYAVRLVLEVSAILRSPTTG